MLAPKLRPGHGVRILAPSCTLPSLPWVTDAFLEQAKDFFRSRGMTVTEGKHLREGDAFGSTTVEARLEDLHAAFADDAVHAIITIRGGWLANSLLARLDYDLIKAHPKVLCGYSDITALQNAIFAKTGLVTYSGPNFLAFGIGDQLHYTFEAFEQCVLHDDPFIAEPSREWTDEFWSPDHQTLAFEHNEGPWILREGESEGRLLGGNLCTLNLLQGSEYMPDLRESVLFLEDDHESLAHTFDRNLQSLLHLPSARGIRGLVIGRFEKSSGVTRALLEQIIASKPELAGLPVIANADFGHTRPMITFPIGGRTRILANNGEATIQILEH